MLSLTGAGMTGLELGVTLTVYISKDGATRAAALGTVEEAGGGDYVYLPTQDETNADLVTLTAEAADAVTGYSPVYTDDLTLTRRADLRLIYGLNPSDASLVLKHFGTDNSAGAGVRFKGSTSAIDIDLSLIHI